MIDLSRVPSSVLPKHYLLIAYRGGPSFGEGHFKHNPKKTPIAVVLDNPPYRIVLAKLLMRLSLSSSFFLIVVFGRCYAGNTSTLVGGAGNVPVMTLILPWEVMKKKKINRRITESRIRIKDFFCSSLF